jgi:hypothetical protein
MRSIKWWLEQLDVVRDLGLLDLYVGALLLQEALARQ